MGMLMVAALLLIAVLPSVAQAQSPVAAMDCCTVPEISTAMGDGGLWIVSSPETLLRRDWGASIYRMTSDRAEGDTNIAHFGATAAYGLSERLEIFGTWHADTRIDRDDLESPATPNDYPFARASWSGDALGDLFVGAKLNLTSYHRGRAVGTAIRGTAKFPTGNSDKGVTTGRSDWSGQFVFGRPFRRSQVIGAVGAVKRLSPLGADVADSVTAGAGLGFVLSSSRAVAVDVTTEFVMERLVGELRADRRRVYTDLLLGTVFRFQTTWYGGVAVRLTPTGKQRSGIQVTAGRRLR